MVMKVPIGTHAIGRQACRAPVRCVDLHQSLFVFGARNANRPDLFSKCNLRLSKIVRSANPLCFIERGLRSCHCDVAPLPTSRRDERPGASDFVDDSALPEAGVRSRSAAIRSARAELSTRALAVESMNDAVDPQS